jgi:hypothetical protein
MTFEEKEIHMDQQPDRYIAGVKVEMGCYQRKQSMIQSLHLALPDK